MSEQCEYPCELPLWSVHPMGKTDKNGNEGYLSGTVEN